VNLCNFDNLIGPYHDGELDSNRRAEVEGHLPGCPQCTAHLASLRRISTRLSAFPIGDISLTEQSRLHRLLNRATVELADRAILRMALPLAALAACVLVVTSVWLADTMKGPGAGPVSGPTQGNTLASDDWEQVAVTLHSDSRLPDWMVRGLGGDAP
jgi:anti-sigma factor RsiW